MVLDGKLANGMTEVAAHVDGTLVVGGPQVVKREPEDLTRKSVSPTERLVVDRRHTLFIPVSDTTTKLDRATKEGLEAQVKEECGDRPRVAQSYTITNAPAAAPPQTTLDPDSKMTTANYIGFATSPQPIYEHSAYLTPSPQSYTTTASLVREATTSEQIYYADYYRNTDPQYTVSRPEYTTTEPTYVDRYQRPTGNYKTVNNLTVDSSPDSGTSSDPGREHTIFTTQVSIFCQWTRICICVCI